MNQTGSINNNNSTEGDIIITEEGTPSPCIIIREEGVPSGPSQPQPQPTPKPLIELVVILDGSILGLKNHLWVRSRKYSSTMIELLLPEKSMRIMSRRDLV